MLDLINGLLGITLLLAGRKLFWLFIGAVGFITGIQLTASIWQGSEWLLLVIGAIVGVIFAALATFLKTLAIGVAGFLSGGYALTILVDMVGVGAGIMPIWVIYTIGGFIGIVLVSLLFDWAIITLSSLAGASLIVRRVFSQSDSVQLIFIALFLLGIIIQGSRLRGEKRRELQD